MKGNAELIGVSYPLGVAEENVIAILIGDQSAHMR